VLTVGLIGALFLWGGVRTFLDLQAGMDTQSDLPAALGAIIAFASVGSTALAAGVIGGIVALICIPLGIILLMRGI
jgi:hypothetical protein